MTKRPKAKSNGSLCVYSFSGSMIVDEGGFEEITIGFEKSVATIKPPIRLALPTWRPIPQLTRENYSRINAGAYPQDLTRIAVLNDVDASGNPEFKIITGDSPEPENLPRDTVSIFVSSDRDERDGVILSQKIFEDLLLWLRVLTQQWWIGRPSEAITGNLHLVVPFSVGGYPRLPLPQAKQTSSPDGMRRVCKEIWRQAISNVENRKVPDPIEKLASDTYYYYFTGEISTAIIVICTMAEIERDRLLGIKGRKISALGVAETDILKQLSIGFEKLFGRNLQSENPATFEFLKSCWIARGAVAHGRQLVWLKNGKRMDFREYPSKDFFDRVSDLVTWLKSLF